MKKACFILTSIFANGLALGKAEHQVPTFHIGIARSQNAAVAVTRSKNREVSDCNRVLVL